MLLESVFSLLYGRGRQQERHALIIFEGAQVGRWVGG